MVGDDGQNKCLQNIFFNAGLGAPATAGLSRRSASFDDRDGSPLSS
jgi:hypothetical protein